MVFHAWSDFKVLPRRDFCHTGMTFCHTCVKHRQLVEKLMQDWQLSAFGSHFSQPVFLFLSSSHASLDNQPQITRLIGDCLQAVLCQYPSSWHHFCTCVFSTDVDNVDRVCYSGVFFVLQVQWHHKEHVEGRDNDYRGRPSSHPGTPAVQRHPLWTVSQWRPPRPQGQSGWWRCG